MASIRETLERVDIIQILPEAERARVAMEVIPRRFAKGRTICREGDTGRTCYIVADGTLAVFAGEPEVEINRLNPGEYFGEMSVLTGAPRSATVRALEDVLVFELDRPTFSQLFARHPRLAQSVSELVANRQIQKREITEEAARAHAHKQASFDILGKVREIFEIELW